MALQPTLCRALAVLVSLVLCTRHTAAQSGEHRWGGLVFDVFARDAGGGTIEAWTVEDGGRIRHRNPSTQQWSFQTTPFNVQDTLRRVHFLPDGQIGWAVGQNGRVLGTTNGGLNWAVLGNQILNPGGGFEELYDVYFLSATEGWLLGKHSFWKSTNGGLAWTPVTVLDASGTPMSLVDPVEAYALDIVERPGQPVSRLGLAVAEPGIVLRSIDPLLMTWRVAFDIQNVCLDPMSYQCIPLNGCESCQDAVLGTSFEPWDVEISRAASPLALLVGGFGNQCGLVLRSYDDGVTWCKEFHECIVNPGFCATNPLYMEDLGDPNDLNRHQRFTTLYGVAIRDSDNLAVAVGYNGQQVVREPSGVWVDRSVFTTAVPTPQGSVKYPLYGVDLAESYVEFPTPINTVIIATGAGGLLRESINDGQLYMDKAVGEPHRIKDVYFETNTHGWVVGELYRIAKTADGAVHWDEQDPEASPADNFRSIAFAPGHTIGVAVGEKDTITQQPKIRYTDFGGVPWREDVTIIGDANFINGKNLREVKWSTLGVGMNPQNSFWAVGSGGLILNSRNDGQRWDLISPEPPGTLAQIHLEGVAFNGTNNLGLFVGRRPTGGAVYQYHKTTPPPVVSWSSIGLPANVVITRLMDVEVVLNTVAWVVGEKLVNNKEEGIVLKSIFNGTTFNAFTEENGPTVFPLCTAGEDLGDPVLNEVEIEPITGEIWVGGMCGRVWTRASGGTGPWLEVKSQTDAHVSGMSFPPNSSAAYIAGQRQSNTQQCIVRVQ